MTIYGPYTRRDGRKHVVVINDDGTKKTKSYPKFLLEEKIGRSLSDSETADHIDEDFRNDDASNLQVLTRSENAKKSNATREREKFKFSCPICGKEAERFMSEVKRNKKVGKAGPFCGKKCAGKYSTAILSKGAGKAFLNALI